MKKKVVIKAVFQCDKCRIKAMKIVVSAAGVTGLELQGDYSNQLVVTGYGIDSAGLTTLIRNKFGSAEIVSHTSISIPEKETDHLLFQPQFIVVQTILRHHVNSLGNNIYLV